MDSRSGKLALIALALGSVVSAGSIADIEHVVLFMQENRAFDHYFGTMAGVRGFKDPNVQVNNGTSVFYQNVDSQLSSASDYLLPWYLNYLGGSWENATQCIEAGSNGWSANHDALNNGSNNMWAIGNTPYSWGHFTRKEIPNHFAIAEGFTVGDMYQEGVIASTSPNRVTWISGTINAPGSPSNYNGGGIYIDNSETPGCEEPGLNCYPLKWKTVPEYFEEAGVSWQVYQDTDNFDDNPLAWFSQYQSASANSPLAKKGLAYNGLESFYKDAAEGTLPEISYIIGPAELSEHPPYTPRDGAWLQQRIVDAVTLSPQYSSTALIISYDETGGWGDHSIPYHSAEGTTGEWVEDPYGEYGYVYTGPGFRLPFYIVSPWSRGSHVFMEHADHSSQIKFLESWLTAKGYKNITTSEMNPWRRQHMSDLTKAFDFEHPDYSIPNMPNASYPSTNSAGQWNGYALCEAAYPTQRPPVPYGKQNASTALATEQGFKQVRGYPTEGRFLVFEQNGYALSVSSSNTFAATKATAQHNSKSQRFVLHESTTTKGVFTLSSATSGKTLQSGQQYQIVDLGNGAGYTLQATTGSKQYLAISTTGAVANTKNQPAIGFAVYSVTYDDSE